MMASVLWLVCASLLFGSSLSCYQCFVEIRDSYRLCWGHIYTKYNVRNVDRCFQKVDNIFNYNEKVIEAGRVGEGYDKQLKEILDAEIRPLADEFEGKLNNDYVYVDRLQKAADNFIAAASKLPRVTGCFPPCGFQARGRVYNCVTCQYDTCEYPLDCPLKEIHVTEGNRTRMWCEVPFQLPDNIELIWRFAGQVKTRLVDEFKEVTAGLDTLFSIPHVNREDQGTYQCEIYADRLSIVRLYFFLNVTPRALVGHTELQDIFDLSIVPGGRLTPVPDDPPPSSLLPSTLLFTAFLTSFFLLFFLSLGALCWLIMPETTISPAESEEDVGLQELEQLCMTPSTTGGQDTQPH